MRGVAGCSARTLPRSSQIETTRLYRLLFLDFDGVLHPTFARPSQWLAHAPALANVLANKQCEVVISSSWRFHYSLEGIRAMLPSLRSRVSHCTGVALACRHARYEEIRAHLALRMEMVDWYALNDSRYEFPEACTRAIFCDPSCGLAEGELRVLHDWLHRQ